MPFKMLATEKCIIPFFDTNQKKTKMDDLMFSFVSIFTDLFSIDLLENPVIFLFMPMKSQKMSDTEKLKLFEDLKYSSTIKWYNHKIIVFHEFNSYKSVIEKNNILHKIVSYNTKLICSYNNIDEYLGSLSSKNRKFIKNSLKYFESSDLEFKKIDMKIYKERAQELYENNCNKFNEISEPKELWNNILDLENVNWYGIFRGKILIMFSGFWTEKNYALLSIFGKDYTFEDVIRKTNAYFYINIKLIECAIQNNIQVIFNGYGISDIKRRLGYEILDYGVSLLN